jgi:hypothetical protein
LKKYVAAMTKEFDAKARELGEIKPVFQILREVRSLPKLFILPVIH